MSRFLIFLIINLLLESNRQLKVVVNNTIQIRVRSSINISGSRDRSGLVFENGSLFRLISIWRMLNYI